MFCFFSKLQDSLRWRDVYVIGSNWWGDFCVRLLQGVDWQVNWIKVYCFLGYLIDLQEVIKFLGYQFDSCYRQVVVCFGENEVVEFDVFGLKFWLIIFFFVSFDELDSLK